MSVVVKRIERKFNIVRADATHVPARWAKQYERTTDPQKMEITRRLNDLISPTKGVVDTIIGNQSWTGVMCSSCAEYVPFAFSCGYDYPTEICEPCLAAGLRALRAEQRKAAEIAPTHPDVTPPQEPNMPDTMHIESELDDARSRLDALKAIKATALDEIRASLQKAQEALGAQDHPLVRARLDRELSAAMDACTDSVDDLLFSEVREAEQEIDAADDALGAIERADLRSSAPVVL